ncbi:hypothetical protein BpHYR1_026143 [Brachionus plicatilis]|uniref:Uncharacterized protein n=1 Tax=Brachionus plicatilis TaxID=10195 RepID=A0A3M7T7C0_BRAPC|nr:hypothetical protein BpHYR1_026143 [Brachionus plicatilis]
MSGHLMNQRKTVIWQGIHAFFEHTRLVINSEVLKLGVVNTNKLLITNELVQFVEAYIRNAYIFEFKHC